MHITELVLELGQDKPRGYSASITNSSRCDTVPTLLAMREADDRDLPPREHLPAWEEWCTDSSLAGGPPKFGFNHHRIFIPRSSTHINNGQLSLARLFDLLEASIYGLQTHPNLG
jgi:hypothetical protein